MLSPLLILLAFLQDPGPANRANLILELRSELCRPEAEAQSLCLRSARDRGLSCAREVQAHEQCFRALPGLLSPTLATLGVTLDANYAVDYTREKPLHYMLRGFTCDGSEGNLQRIAASLRNSGIEATLWVARLRPVPCN